MSDTTTLDEPPELLAESEWLGADTPVADTPLRRRVVLPFLVPLLSIAIVALLVLNISRAFLAGEKDAALVTSIVITLAILVGASIIAAAPHLTTSSLAVILCGLLFVVSIAGLVSLGPSLDDGESAAAGFQYARGPATSKVSVVAEPSIRFNATEYTADAGVVRLDYSGVTSHTLAIQDSKYDGFLLSTIAGGREAGKVRLPPGTYTLYCTIGDHAAQGMKATLTVSAEARDS